MNIILRNIFFIAIIVPFLSCKNQAKEGKAEIVSMNINDVHLVSLSGEPIDWKKFEGNAVFINFWATWCKPCINEMPSIRNMMEKMKNEKISFLFASEESADQINGFKERTGFVFPFVRVENSENLNIMVLPTTYIFTASGNLAFTETGYRKWDDTAAIKQITAIIVEK